MTTAIQQNPFLNLGLSAFQTAQQPFNPQYLDNVSNSLYNQANYNYQTNLAPTLNANAMRAGGYGGSRAALAQGVVMDRLNQNVTNAMAPMYAQGYENSMNRALQAGNMSAGTGMGLEQLDLNRLLGIGNLTNQTNVANANIAQGAGDLALREQLGYGNLGIAQQGVNNQTAQLALNAAGVPTYTSPIAAGIGGAGTLYALLNSILGNG